MWLFWVWGVAALLQLGIAAVPALLGWGAARGDNVIVGFFALVVGLPAWLILVALTFTRWRTQSRVKSTIQITPAVVAAVIVVTDYLRW